MSKEVPMDSNDDEEPATPKVEGMGPSNPSEHSIDHQEELEGIHEPVDPVVPEIRKRLTWLRLALQEVEGHATPRGTFKEGTRPKRYFGYATLITNLIDCEPLNDEEETR